MKNNITIEKSKISLLGYTQNFTILQAGKIESTLTKLIRYDNKIINKAEYTQLIILEGCRPKTKENYTYYSKKLEGYTKPKTLYMLSHQTENYYHEVTKTEYNYAIWLLDNNLVNEENLKSAKEKEYKRLYNIELELLEKEKEEQQKQELIRIENENFENWYNEEINNYNNTDLINLAIQIYSHYINGYNLLAIKKILVLIDNIDNNKCKDKLINWLHNENKASIRVFEYVTGIKLENTYSKRVKQLESINKNNFIGSKEFNKVKRELKDPSLVEFKIRKGIKGEIIETVQGEILNNNFGINCFIFKGENGYSITEYRTGVAIVQGENNKSNLIKIFKEKLSNENTLNYLKNAIDKQVKERFNNEVLNVA